MEALLIRIDMLRDRRQYVTILKQWLAELAIAHGRLVTMGDVHLLFIAADAAKITQLLEFYATRAIDTNSRGELCIDKFIDIVGRKSIEASGCKGFLEMNILNASMLEKMLVHEWQSDKEWLESALATPRTRALLAWREETKALRKDRRQKSAKERQATKDLKKQQQEEQAAAEAAAKAAQARADAEAAADPEDADKDGSGSGSSTEEDSDAARASAAEHQQRDQALDDSDDGSAAVVPAVAAPRRQHKPNQQRHQQQKQAKPQPQSQKQSQKQAKPQQQQQKGAKRPHPPQQSQSQSHKRSKQQKKTHAGK